MNNLLDIKTPAQSESGQLKSDFGLESHGLVNLGHVYWNLPAGALYEEIVFRREGHVTRHGALAVRSGSHTARAANDKYIVREPSSEDNVWWGEYNRPYNAEQFDELYSRLQGFLQGRDVFVQDCFAGADPDYRLPVRIISELGWHSLFARNMFIRPDSLEAYKQHVPEFTVVCVPSFKAFQPVDSTNSGTFIALDLERKLCIIGDTAYAGEIKKSVFTVLNYLLPLQGVMTMHCSSNVGPKGDVALFFGLSGTGKTTLSTDPGRRLIGDDEHGWNDHGIFNFEGGSYAKVIRISSADEPQIYAATHRFGTILENVIYDPVSRRVDFDNPEITENTRASYPLGFIENSLDAKRAGHPENIFLLTCDASGVMPPIARLTTDQALYQFISGYTAKVGGTEVGLGEEPEITFSTCFGAPFMVHHPAHYADLLRRKMERYGSTAWLLNTGWIGGPFGVGKRISISHTRSLLNSALNGTLAQGEFAEDPLFGFEVPKSCEGVPQEILRPASSWGNEEEYMAKYRQLATRFVDNFRKFAPDCPPEIAAAGPRV